MKAIILSLGVISLFCSDLHAAISNDFSSSSGSNLGSVMNDRGKPRYITKLNSIPMQSDYDFTIRVKWEPEHSNIESPIGAEWVLLGFDSNITVTKDSMWIQLPGGKKRLLNPVSDKEYRRHKGGYVATLGRRRGDYTVTSEDRWILTYKKGRLYQAMIPVPGQKLTPAIKDEEIKRNTYTWKNPLDSKDGKGGIYSETDQKWVFQYDFYPDAALDQPSATIKWAEGNRVLSFYRTEIKSASQPNATTKPQVFTTTATDTMTRRRVDGQAEIRLRKEADLTCMEWLEIML